MVLTRPLALSRAWVEAALRRAHRWRVAARLTLVFAFVIGGSLALQLCNERLLWRQGALAASAEVSVHESTVAGVLHHIELDVRYRAGEGRRGGPDGSVSFWTLGWTPGSAGAFAVRWSGAQFVSSWQREAASARWWAIGALQLVAGLLAAGLFAGARRVRARRIDLERVARVGQQIELPIVRAWAPWYADVLPRAIVFRWMRYRVTVPTDADPGQASYRDPARVVTWQARTFTFRADQRALLIVGDAPGRLLALRDPERARRLVFVRADGWPFAAVASS